jgi:hypothetical protein
MVNKTYSQTDVKSITEPEFTGVILLVENDSIAIPLEKQRATVETKSGTFAGFGKGTAGCVVNGAKSKIRTTQKTKLRFIAKASENSEDPTQAISFFKLQSDKKGEKRFLIMATSKTQGIIGGSSAVNTTIKYLPFVAKKYGKSSYLLETVELLEPGEYCLSFDRINYCMFGIDE